MSGQKAGPVAVLRDDAHIPGMEARLGAVEADTREIKSVLARLEPVIIRIDVSTRKLETDVARIDASTRKLEADTARLDGRVSQLPTTIQLLGFVLAVLALGGVMRHFWP